MGGEARAPVPSPTPGLGGREPRAESAPLVSPARASALTADRSAERRPRVGGGGGGAHSHPWGVGPARLREARGAEPFGFPADQNPGAASSFGGRSRRRGPRARGGAELGRGRAGAGAAAGARRGRPGLWGPRAVAVPGRPMRPAGRSGPPSPVLAPSAAPQERLPSPSPGGGRIPSPSAWLRSPWNFSEERLLRKEAKRTKTQRGRGLTSGGFRAGFRRLGPLPSPAPRGCPTFQAVLP